MAPALLVLKATILLLAALGVAVVYRRSPVRLHQAWTAAFAAILALPLLALVLPRIDVPVAPLWPVDRIESSIDTAGATSSSDSAAADLAALNAPDGAAHDMPAQVGFTWPGVMVMMSGLWAAGSACALIMLALSFWRVRRLAASATEVTDPDWRLAAGALAGQLGLPRSVRLLLTDRLDTPMAGGFRRPTIFLPVSCTAWTAECRDAVFAHELVHLARRDPLRHLAARLTLAIYWFHPAAWLAARWAALACEEACDAEVVRCGIRPSSYARILLELAESAGQRRAPLSALSIVQPSRLERRLTMILNNDTTPRRARTLPLLASAGAVLTMALAAAEPRAAAAAASGPAAAGQPVPSCQSDWVDAAGAPAGAAADLGGRMEYRERIDERGYTRSIVKGFGDLRLCLFAEDTGDARRPSEIARRAARVVLEARQAGVVQQLELTKAGATWRVNGAIPPSDAVAAEWRQHLLGVLDATWDLAAIRGDARVRQDDWRTGELEARRQADLARLLTIVEGKGASPAGARPSAQ